MAHSFSVELFIIHLNLTVCILYLLRMMIPNLKVASILAVRSVSGLTFAQACHWYLHYIITAKNCANLHLKWIELKYYTFVVVSDWIGYQNEYFKAEFAASGMVYRIYHFFSSVQSIFSIETDNLKGWSRQKHPSYATVTHSQISSGKWPIRSSKNKVHSFDWQQLHIKNAPKMVFNWCSDGSKFNASKICRTFQDYQIGNYIFIANLRVYSFLTLNLHRCTGNKR